MYTMYNISFVFAIRLAATFLAPAVGVQKQQKGASVLVRIMKSLEVLLLLQCAGSEMNETSGGARFTLALIHYPVEVCRNRICILDASLQPYESEVCRVPFVAYILYMNISSVAIFAHTWRASFGMRLRLRIALCAG